jgi:hypothetical protein
MFIGVSWLVSLEQSVSRSEIVSGSRNSSFPASAALSLEKHAAVSLRFILASKEGVHEVPHCARRRGALVFCVIAVAATAQTTSAAGDQIAFDRPEAWAMKYFTSATTLSGLTTPDRPQPGSLAIQFESGWLPRWFSGISVLSRG